MRRMIGRLNHVAIAVPDLAAAAKLYRETLGAEVSEPVDMPEHGVTTVFVTLPNTKIELLHPLGMDSPIAGRTDGICLVRNRKHRGAFSDTPRYRRAWPS